MRHTQPCCLRVGCMHEKNTFSALSSLRQVWTLMDTRRSMRSCALMRSNTGAALNSSYTVVLRHSRSLENAPALLAL